MHFRSFAFLTGLAGVLWLAQGQIAAQSTASESWTAPRAQDGHPDLQGVWANNMATPLQRPIELGSRASLTDEEVAAMKKKASELFDNGASDAAFGDSVFAAAYANLKGIKSGFKSTDGETGDYSSVWLVSREWDNRTSLITDPPDGRIPPLTPQAAGRLADARRNRIPAGPEDRSLSERCITFGAPRFQAGYNSYYQIFQTAKVAVIQMETIHDARIIPLDGSPHPPANVKQWLGDSRGHWEGDTLVIDTANYLPGAFRGASDQLHAVERLTRTGPDTIQYEVTMNDPETWTQPWTVMIPLRHSNEPMFEYACHEGNYGLAGILAGARAEEAEAAKAGSR